MANVSRETKSGRDTAIVGALRKGKLGFDQIPLGGKLYTQSEAADLVQKRMDARSALLRAKAEWLDAIKTYEELDAQVDIAVRDLRNVVIGAHGETSDAMAAFEFAPRKRRVFTPEQIVAIVAKRNATRVARGTKGRKQKLAIKGVVPVETAAPMQVVAVSAAASAADPAVIASPSTLEGHVTPVTAQPPGEPGSKSG